MNKYFLPLISIFILFQTFHIFDEIFFKEKDQKIRDTLLLKVQNKKMRLKQRKLKKKLI